MDYKEKAYVSIVVYLFNDAEGIRSFVGEVAPLFQKKFEYCQWVFVDDFSTDDTFNAASSVMKEMGLPGSVICLSQKHGRERGLLAGLDKALGDFIFEFDRPVVDFSRAPRHRCRRD